MTRRVILVPGLPSLHINTSWCLERNWLSVIKPKANDRSSFLRVFNSHVLEQRRFLSHLRPSGHLWKSSETFGSFSEIFERLRVIETYPSMRKRRFRDVVGKLYAPVNRDLLLANHNRRAEQTWTNQNLESNTRDWREIKSRLVFVLLLTG